MKGGGDRQVFSDFQGVREMSRVLVIGAGGVSSVAVHKMAQLPDIFSHITLASGPGSVRRGRRFGEDHASA
jgi:D-arabinose 1-dehydrogenase-like Zn-dependent alcohol dehydrogenase